MNNTIISMQAGATPDQPATKAPKKDICLGPFIKLSLESIQPNPFQIRSSFPELELRELAASIAKIGLMEPVIVRETDDFSYQMISGERRLRAFKLLNKTEIPCIVTKCSDADMAVITIAANISALKLSDYEIAKDIHNVEDQFSAGAYLAETLGMFKEELNCYLVYDALPAVAIEKLEANPRLLSRAAAYDIKKVFAKTTSENYETALIALKKALDLLEACELDEIDVADFIEQKLEHPGEIKPIFIEGKQVGYYLISDESINIHIDPGVLSDEQIEAFMNKLNKILNEPEDSSS